MCTWHRQGLCWSGVVCHSFSDHKLELSCMQIWHWHKAYVADVVALGLTLRRILLPCQTVPFHPTVSSKLMKKMETISTNENGFRFAWWFMVVLWLMSPFSGSSEAENISVWSLPAADINRRWKPGRSARV